MHPSSITDILPWHKGMWQRLQPMRLNDQIPHALLFVGPRHIDISSFVNQWVASILCDNAPACGRCSHCNMLIEATHPDIQYVRQEAPDKAIKIDQIRNVQHAIYQTPQRGKRRFIVIESAERMNISAANALLKVLEEPPAHTLFILVAEQVGSVPPTILSRCQKFIFSDTGAQESTDFNDYLAIGRFYPDETTRAELFKESEAMIALLCDMIEGNESPCTLASSWALYDFNDLLWWLYLVNAQAISVHIYNTVHSSTTYSKQIIRLSRCISPFDLFNLLDKISALRKKLIHNVTVNQTLAIEDLLLGYTGMPYV